MPELSGKYKLSHSEHFDDYLKAKGVNVVMRKVAQAGSPVLEILLDGENLCMKMYLPIKTIMDVKCKLGEEFDFTRPDGAKVKCTITKDGDNKLVAKQVDEKGEEEIVTREWTDDDTVVMSMSHGDIHCKRTFKRQA